MYVATEPSACQWNPLWQHPSLQSAAWMVNSANLHWVSRAVSHKWLTSTPWLNIRWQFSSICRSFFRKASLISSNTINEGALTPVTIVRLCKQLYDDKMAASLNTADGLHFGGARKSWRLGQRKHLSFCLKEAKCTKCLRLQITLTINCRKNVSSAFTRKFAFTSFLEKHDTLLPISDNISQALSDIKQHVLNLFDCYCLWQTFLNENQWLLYYDILIFQNTEDIFL